jgi:hypothetical protein
LQDGYFVVEQGWLFSHKLFPERGSCPLFHRPALVISR